MSYSQASQMENSANFTSPYYESEPMTPISADALDEEMISPGVGLRG